MQNKQRSGIVAGILLPMGLICLFAFCSLALALMGGGAYRDIHAQVENSYDTTVAANYLHTKLSQNSREGAVSLREEDGLQVLVIATEIQERSFETRIFLAAEDEDGARSLVETFGSADLPLSAASGNLIARLESCVFTLEDDLFTAELKNSGGSVTRTAFALTQGGSL